MPTRDGYTTIQLQENTAESLRKLKGTATYDQALQELIAKKGEQ